MPVPTKPNDSPVTSRAEICREEGVLSLMPFGWKIRKPNRDRIFNSSPLAGTIRAAIAVSGALVDPSVPFVTLCTAPPHFLVTVRPHILRREPLVARRMPLRSKFRVRFRERIGDRHRRKNIPHATSAKRRFTFSRAPPGRTAFSGGVPVVLAALYHRLFSLGPPGHCACEAADIFMSLSASLRRSASRSRAPSAASAPCRCRAGTTCRGPARGSR